MNHTLELLVPGQEVEVQIAVKCALNDNAGHWSGWSQPERAVVPQSAGEFKPEGDQWVSSAGTGTTSWDLHRQSSNTRLIVSIPIFQMIFLYCVLRLIWRGSPVSGTGADTGQRQSARPST